MTDFDVTSLYGRRATQRWNRMVVGDIFERLVWSHPDREVLVAFDGACSDERFARVTYRQADAAANQVAHALLAAGLERGDRVAMLCDNSVEALLAMVGVAKAGMVCAPLNAQMANDVIAQLIERVGARFAIVDAGLWSNSEAGFTAAGLAPAVTIPIDGGPVDGSASFAAWIAGQPTSEPNVEVHADDVWQLLFTSGTTALPKASMGTHTYSYLAAYSWALSVTRGLRFEDQVRLGTFLPITYHCGHHATLLPAVFCGGTLVVGRRPDPVATAAAITQEGITALWAGSPQFLAGLAAAAHDHPAVDLSSLTVAFFAWGAISPDLADDLAELCRGVELMELFGQTEAMSCYRFWRGQHDELFRRSAPLINYVGGPNPMLGATIMDADGRILRDEPGVAGEAVYRGPTVTVGYYQDEPATREAFAGGWFHSGDSCSYDRDGLQIMVDRYKDIVKSGGETVSSQRVESVLHQHPHVVRAAVIGLPDPKWGELLTAVVIVEPGIDLDAGDVVAFCRARLAGYETPKRVVQVDRMPETVGGKILKYRLREDLAEG